MIIACDIDGVLADFNKGFVKLFPLTPNAHARTQSETFPQVWDWPRQLGASREETEAAWKHVEESPSFWKDLEAMEGAVIALELLCAATVDHTIYFVTKRFGKECRRQSIEWLEQHGMPPHPGGKASQVTGGWQWDVIISPQDETKADVIKAIKADLFIEDRPNNLIGVPPHTRCYLFDRPYNTDGRMKAEGVEVGRLFMRTSSVEAVLRREIWGSKEGSVWEAFVIAAPAAASSPDNPKDGIGAAKIPMHLWPESATITGALGLLDGALKYERNNWRDAGVRASIYVDALRRHLARWWEGEDSDPDSGLPHEAHMLACLAIVVDAKALNKLIDDRNHKGEGFIKEIEALTPHVARLQDRHRAPAKKPPLTATRLLCGACALFFRHWRCNKEDECSCPRCQGTCECEEIPYEV